MPYTYHSQHQPPWMVDRILARPGDISMAGAAGALGVVAVSDGFSPYFINLAFAAMPTPLKIVAGVVLILGALLALVGMIWHPEQFELSWATEAAGWLFIAGPSIAFTVASLYLFPAAAVTWIFTTALAATAVFRVAALILTVLRARRIDQAVKQARRSSTGRN